MQSQNLSDFLVQPGGIASLLPQAKHLIELRQVMATLIPQTLARSCILANYKQGKVVIFAANSAVAAKLKLLRPVLSEQLSKRGVQVTGMEIHVQPPEKTHELHEKHAQISSVTAQTLVRTSAKLPDSELKTVLLRLASRKP